MDLSFEEANSSSDLLESLEKVTGIFKVIAPAWKQCPNIKSSQDDQIKKVTSMLEIFANPSTYNIYSIALATFENWREVNVEINKAIGELDRGKCARAGFVFGKILRKVIESDASLTKMVWGKLEKAAEILSDVGAKAKGAFGDVFKAGMKLFDEL